MPHHVIGGRASARIIVEVLRAIGADTTSLGCGLTLLAAIYEVTGRSDDTTSNRWPRSSQPEPGIRTNDVSVTDRLL
jgi:hypothetical protein